MLFWLYNFCFPFVFLALLPGYLWRMIRRGDYRAQFGQRLGWYSPALRSRLANGPPRLWIQAVSVGEMFTALKLVDALRKQSPGLTLILSTTTTTGLRLAQARSGAHVEAIYTPIDLLPVVRRAFHVLRPAAVVIVDGGLWPNQLREARRRGLPTALLNARLSPRSERRFLKFRPLSRSIFAQLDLVGVPEKSDVTRWAALGVPAANIQFTGSIKYDDTAAENSPDQNSARVRGLLDRLGVSAGRHVLLAASTHAGEESLFAEAFITLRRSHPDLFLILAPRHVERAAAVAEELQRLGEQTVRRTELGGETATAPPGASTSTRLDCLLLDTTGELREWYPTATLVLIGKSWAAIGGQNPAEAISVRVPVIVGPHMENFADLTRSLLSANAMIQLQDPSSIPAACHRLLNDPGERTRLAEAAYGQLEKHRGAAQRSAVLLLSAVKLSTC